MFDKIQYKLWKHLNKKMTSNKIYHKKEEKNHSANEINKVIVTDISNLEISVKNVKKQVDDIKNIMILKELFPDFVKEMLPSYDHIKSKFLFNALDRSYFQENEGKHIRELFALKLRDMLSVILSVSGGLTHIEYGSILEHFNEKNIDLANNEELYLRAYLAAHYTDHPVFNDIKNEISDGYFRPYGEYFYKLYICYLMYTQDLDVAKKSLRYYEKTFGLENIKKNLLLAALAYEMGHKEEEFLWAQTIYSALKKSEDENLLAKIIAGKSVAIVGNGPQQNGKKTGKEIDKYDIVIRFNDYAEDEKYIDDLGKKTDIWCEWIAFPLSLHNLKNIKYVLIATDIYTWGTTHQLNPNLWKDLYEYICNGGKILSYSYNIRRELLKINCVPTSGFSLVYWIKTIKQDFKKSNCYGFSFLEENISTETKRTWFHYSGAMYSTNKLDHSLQKEKELLDALFEKGE